MRHFIAGTLSGTIIVSLTWWIATGEIPWGSLALFAAFLIFAAGYVAGIVKAAP